MDSGNLIKNKIFADFSIEALLRKDDDRNNTKRKSWGTVQQSTFLSASPELCNNFIEKYSNDAVRSENDKDLISASDDSDQVKLHDNENHEDSSSESTFAWMTCTRFKPPKLPRPRRKGTSRRNGRGPRIPFSTHQLALLESTFGNSQYLSTEAIARLAESLHLTETRVKIWFQNRRARFRREKESNLHISKLEKSSSSTTEGFPTNHHFHQVKASSKSSNNIQSFRHLINDLHLMAAGATTKVSSNNLLYNLNHHRMSPNE